MAHVMDAPLRPVAADAEILPGDTWWAAFTIVAPNTGQPVDLSAWEFGAELGAAVGEVDASDAASGRLEVRFAPEVTADAVAGERFALVGTLGADVRTFVLGAAVVNGLGSALPVAGTKKLYPTDLLVVRSMGSRGPQGVDGDSVSMTIAERAEAAEAHAEAARDAAATSAASAAGASASAVTARDAASASAASAAGQAAASSTNAAAAAASAGAAAAAQAAAGTARNNAETAASAAGTSAFSAGSSAAAAQASEDDAEAARDEAVAARQAIENLATNLSWTVVPDDPEVLRVAVPTTMFDPGDDRVIVLTATEVPA